MVARKRKKSSRLHGSTTHGWGARKKHRGSGNRGGFGMAGTGKRSDGKKTMIWNNTKYFGKHGFKKKGQITKINPISLNVLQNLIYTFVQEKKIKCEGDTFVVDLGSLGYNKLLGTGVINKKMKITVDFASAGAIEKVKQAGGEVVVQKGETE